MSQSAPKEIRPATVPAGGGAGAADEALEGEAGMPVWVEAMFPWVLSVLLHTGIGMLALFLWWWGTRAGSGDGEREAIIIPVATIDPASAMAGDRDNKGGGMGDTSRDAAQDWKKEVERQDGWAQVESKDNVSGYLSGDAGENVADMIGRGVGGSVGGAGKGGTGTGDGGVLAPYGTPGGGSGGPRTRFYGAQANATKIVYVLDHSGSMLDTFSFLQDEVKRSVEGLLPVQSFSVIVFSEDVEVLGQAALVRATPENKREAVKKMNAQVARGQNDDLLDPFKQAFEKAFAMNPQVIYFLTDGRFDDRLINEVNEKMNKNKRVRINTIAFVSDRKDYMEQLQNLAKVNGGMFKFVSQKDLGRN